MKKLEEIFIKKRKSFDSEEPSANHFIKFLDKLDTRQIHLKRDRIIKILTHVASVAAVILLLVSVVLLHNTSSPDEKITYQMSTEVMEINMFYQSQIDDYLQTLNNTIKSCPVQKKNLQSCFRELNKSFESIQHDLKENPGDERVINALVNHYRMKLEIIDQALEQSNRNCI